jgi:hypothetical protein
VINRFRPDGAAAKTAPQVIDQKSLERLKLYFMLAHSLITGALRRI